MRKVGREWLQKVTVAFKKIKSCDLSAPDSLWQGGGSSHARSGMSGSSDGLERATVLSHRPIQKFGEASDQSIKLVLFMGREYLQACLVNHDFPIARSRGLRFVGRTLPRENGYFSRVTSDESSGWERDFP